MLFSPEEWREVGDKLWELTISVSGKDSKEAQGHRAAWCAIIGALREMKAESKVAAAALQTLGAVPPTAPSHATGALFRHGSSGPIKGMMGKTCSNIRELLNQAQTGIGEAQPGEFPRFCTTPWSLWISVSPSTVSTPAAKNRKRPFAFRGRT